MLVVNDAGQFAIVLYIDNGGMNVTIQN